MDTGRRLRDAEPGARELWMGAGAYRVYCERSADGPPHPLLAGVPVYLDPEIPPDQVMTHCPELIETMAEWGPALLRDEGAPVIFPEGD
jgi:hypothetical protein